MTTIGTDISITMTASKKHKLKCKPLCGIGWRKIKKHNSKIIGNLLNWRLKNQISSSKESQLNSGGGLSSLRNANLVEDGNNNISKLNQILNLTILNNLNSKFNWYRLISSSTRRRGFASPARSPRAPFVLCEFVLWTSRWRRFPVFPVTLCSSWPSTFYLGSH